MDNAIYRANAQRVKNLRPEKYFHFFAEMAALPRGSGDTAKVAEYLVNFASQRGLDYSCDSVGNVIIRKPAQNSDSGRTVILQAHQDMVCVKTPESTHNFTTDPLTLIVDGDWLRADSTTLGADNGAGLAAILAILDSTDLSHPALEGLFTVDEETSMTGIKAVQADQLAGDILINIDAEEYGIAYVSCAAGATCTLTLPVERQKNAKPRSHARIVLEGLKGGHSGVEINQARANAFVLLGRFFLAARRNGISFGLCEINNGAVPGKDNGIPGHAEAIVSLDTDDTCAALEKLAHKLAAVFRNEFRVSDPGVAIGVEKIKNVNFFPLTDDSISRLLDAIALMPLGAIRYLQDTERMEKPYGELLVETSNNMGIIVTEAAEIHIKLMARGSVASSLEEVENKITALASLLRGTAVLNGRTDGWEMADPPSLVQLLFKNIGWKLVGVHAGLECGTLVDKYKTAGRTLDAISIGPDVRGGHTTEERLGISSVQKCWDDLLEILRKL